MKEVGMKGKKIAEDEMVRLMSGSVSVFVRLEGVLLRSGRQNSDKIPRYFVCVC